MGQYIKRTVSLRWLMIFGFGGIVTFSVAIVLVMSVAANFANTFSLLNDQAVRLLDGMERSIRVETAQAERAVKAVAQAYADQEFEIGDPDSQRQLLKALLMSAPVIETLLVYNSDGNRSGLARLPDESYFSIAYEMPRGPNELREFKAGLGRQSLIPVWGEPVILRDILYHNVSVPLIKNGEFNGAVVAAIGRYTLNEIISKLGNAYGTTAFVLSTDEKVVAHSDLPGVFQGQPVIPLSDFPDPVMQSWQSAVQLNDWYERQENLNIFETEAQDGHIFVTRKLVGYATRPYILGAYFKKADIGTEIFRAFRSAFVGIIALILAVLAALWLSGRLATPMRRIAETARKFSELDLTDFKPLPHSRIAEIEEQATAMNSMHTALNEFAHYVPHAVVKQLLATGPAAVRSIEREVTILFTDLTDFTAQSEYLNASETASLLNSHFNLICEHIDQFDGTIDKFLGDGVMAFWGAPEPDDDHAANAVAAAVSIANAMHARNEQRRQSAEKPLRLRMGLHTGRVVVGNIGAHSRRNYTIVGDAVNVANRLEQLGKNLKPVLDISLLVSETTFIRASAPRMLKPRGEFKLRGRNDSITVYALE